MPGYAPAAAPVGALPPPVTAEEYILSKDRQLEELTRYAASLQQILQAEQAKLQTAVPQSESTSLIELYSLHEQVDDVVDTVKAIGADVAKASEIATQLNGWFIENSAKLRFQDNWASPSAYLESSTVELQRQNEGLASRLTSLQASLAAQVSFVTASSALVYQPDPGRTAVGNASAQMGSPNAAYGAHNAVPASARPMQKTDDLDHAPAAVALRRATPDASVDELTVAEAYASPSPAQALAAPGSYLSSYVPTPSASTCESRRASAIWLSGSASTPTPAPVPGAERMAIALPVEGMDDDDAFEELASPVVEWAPTPKGIPKYESFWVSGTES